MATLSEADRKTIVRRIDALRTQGKTVVEACATMQVSENFYFNWKRRLTPAPHANGTAPESPVATGPKETVPMPVFLQVVRERDELRKTLFKILTGEIDTEVYAEKLIAAQLGMQAAPTPEPEDSQS